MNLYNVQDLDRPMWIAANTCQEAIDKWRSQIAKENDSSIEEVGEPQGVQLVCENNDDFPEYIP